MYFYLPAEILIVQVNKIHKFVDFEPLVAIFTHTPLPAFEGITYINHDVRLAMITEALSWDPVESAQTRNPEQQGAAKTISSGELTSFFISPKSSMLAPPKETEQMLIFDAMDGFKMVPC